jgi:NAD(P)H-dependent FMN reductase
MRILAVPASSSRQSINRQLLQYATDLLEAGQIEGVDGAKVEMIDLNDYEMPIYSIDRQNEGGIPPEAQDFYDRIGQADALLISFAEHNGFYTAAYKNLFDWTSRIDMKVYQDTPTVMFATSVGGGGGGNVLRAAVGSAPFFGNDLKASLSIPSFGANFDVEQGLLTDPELDRQFRAALAAFAEG